MGVNARRMKLFRIRPDTVSRTSVRANWTARNTALNLWTLREDAPRRTACMSYATERWSAKLPGTILLHKAVRDAIAMANINVRHSMRARSIPGGVDGTSKTKVRNATEAKPTP